MDRLKVSFVKLVRAMLMVLGDTGVFPFFFINGLFVFFPASLVRPGSLANVDGLVEAVAGVFFLH